MARSDLLVNLVKAATSADRPLLQSVVEAIIADERGKQHNVLADRLQSALSSRLVSPQMSLRPVDAVDKGRDFLSEVHPKRQLEELFLPPQVVTACRALIEEQQRADLLRSHSLEPRHRVLLVGPPGNGKTTLAEAFAEALAVPLLVVRYEAMIGSYLGETAGRLKRVFDYARSRQCVLFFDEFDAVGKERGDKHDTGEIKRVVTSLLMQMDELPSYTVVVAATNHAELLDKAVWRRFQLRLNLPCPSSLQAGMFIDSFFENAGHSIGVKGSSVARRLGPLSYAEVEEFCLDVLRQHVLSMGTRDLREALASQTRNWISRVQPEKKFQGEASRARTSTSKTRSSR